MLQLESWLGPRCGHDSKECGVLAKATEIMSDERSFGRSCLEENMSGMAGGLVWAGRANDKLGDRRNVERKENMKGAAFLKRTYRKTSMRETWKENRFPMV